MKNRRSGHSHKTLAGDRYELTLDTPSDRDGTLDPQRIPKHQRRIPGCDDKIRALSSKGMKGDDHHTTFPEIVRELSGG